MFQARVNSAWDERTDEHDRNIMPLATLHATEREFTYECQRKCEKSARNTNEKVKLNINDMAENLLNVAI